MIFSYLETFINYLGNTELQKVTNHPPHLVDGDGNLSPTALIPFCSFKEDMSMIGEKINQFSVPVCNIFRSKILQDQLCYEVDPNEYIQRGNGKNVKSGLHLSLFIHTNEERQFSKSRVDPNDFYIIINTIGNVKNILEYQFFLGFSALEASTGFYI